MLMLTNHDEGKSDEEEDCSGTAETRDAGNTRGVRTDLDVGDSDDEGGNDDEGASDDDANDDDAELAITTEDDPVLEEASVEDDAPPPVEDVVEPTRDDDG